MSTYEANRYNFSGASITALNGSNIASGTVADARIPNLSAAKITSGTFADARVSSSSVTAHVSAITTAVGTWTPSPSGGTLTSVTGRYVRVDDIVYCYAEMRFNNDMPNNDDIYYYTGLPISPFTGGGHGAGGGTGNIGSGEFEYNGGTASVFVMDNGRIYPHTAGMPQRMVATDTHMSSGNPTGLIRKQTMRNQSSNSFSQWHYMHFTYQAN